MLRLDLDVPLVTEIRIHRHGHSDTDYWLCWGKGFPIRRRIDGSMDGLLAGMVEIGCFN